MKIYRLFLLFSIILITSNLTAEVRNFLAEVSTESGLNYRYKGSIASSDKLAVKKNICYDEKGRVVINERTEYNEMTCEIVNMMIRDFNTGKVEIIVDKGENYLVKYKKDHNSEFKEKEIPKNGIIIHPTVIAMYMQQNMDAILSGNGVSVKLLLPSRLSTIEFIISDNGCKEIEGQLCHEVALEPSSLIIKQFVNPIYFYVKQDDPSVLVKYEGVVAPKDRDGKSQHGYILFSFN